MVKVLFFARIREQLGCANLSIKLNKNIMNVEQLIEFIAEDNGKQWLDILRQSNIVIAVNQVKVDAGQSVEDGDEVAFYPPVTGG